MICILEWIKNGRRAEYTENSVPEVRNYPLVTFARPELGVCTEYGYAAIF